MLKGSLDSSHFNFEINVEENRIRHRTTLKLNEVNISSMDFESIKKFIIQFQSRSMSDSTLSDIDFRKKGLGLDFSFITFQNLYVYSSNTV